MSKPRSKKFWITFWSISAVFLVGFWFALQIKNKPVQTVSNVIDNAPWLNQKPELKSVAYFANYLLKKDNRGKVFLILFQNNMELRPGGGYIGSFGVLKIKNGHVEELQTHDLSNFDGRIPDGIPAPYPMNDTLKVFDWKLRDSNWSADFSENAARAEYFYQLGEGQENFDGIIAINTNVLASFLEITGPITLSDYPGTYDSENAILNLEYQVEKGYADQEIEKSDRKDIVTELASSIFQKVFDLNISQKLNLAKNILEDLNRKNIQLYFKDEKLQAEAKAAGWSGEVRTDWNADYLLLLDANLGAYKSDYYIRRHFDYTVDLTGEKARADLKITYTHTGKTKDWMTRDYLSYLRIYVPKGSWLEEAADFPSVRFGEEFDKKYFGTIVKVPLNSEKTFEFKYTLPENLNLKDSYNLLIQKQSGAENVTGHITAIKKDGSREEMALDLTGDWILEN